MEKKKKKQSAPREPWPFLTGSPTDSRTPAAAGKFFLSTLGLMVALLILGTMMMWNNVILRVIMNALVQVFAYGIYWQSGLGAGTQAVNLGEILHQRRSTGREVNASELKQAYHPAKGFIIALLGSLPMFLCALVLALTTEKVLTGAGALPSWLESLERREEIGGALAMYHQSASLSVTDVTRLLIRMILMPLVNIVGAGSKGTMVALERLSPLLVLIPGVCYGLGYMGGVQVRSQVHADIEAGKRRIKRRQKRERQQRAKREQGPGQLN